MTWRRALGWSTLGALWLLFAASASVSEGIAAATAAAIVVAAVVRVARSSGIDARVRVRWFVRLVRLPWQVALDLQLLAAHLVRRRQSSLWRQLDFDVRGFAPEDVGRRALLTAAASLGPNSYVADWNVDEQQVLVHQLERSPRVLPTAGGTYP